MDLNVVDKTPQIRAGGGKRVVPTNKARERLGISYEKFMANVDIKGNKGPIKYQALIEDEDNSRPILGFDIKYLDEINKALGSKRGPGVTVFTEEALKRITLINKKWPTR